MNRLSLELWQSILEQCSTRDLLRVRLVNQPLARASAPQLFRHVQLCCSAFSLDHIQNLAQSSHADHVRKITIWTTQIVRRSRAEFEELLRFYDVRTEDEEQKEIDLIPRESWNDIWQSYESCYNDQQAFFTGPEKRSILIEAMKRFPKLREIVIRPFEQTVPISVYSKPSVLPYNDPESPKVDQISSFKPVFSIKLVEDMARCAQGMHWEQDAKIIAWVLDALGERAKLPANMPFQRLRITATLPDVILCPQNLEGPLRSGFDEQMHGVLAMLGQLQVVELHLRLNMDREDVLLKEIRTLIEACHRLESLNIDCGSWLGDVCDGSAPLLAPFSDMLAANRWPHLREICLATNLRAEDMIVFLKAHSSALRSLTLDDCLFDHLSILLPRIPALVKLQHVALKHLTDFTCLPDRQFLWFLDGIDGTKVQEWLLVGQGEEPTWKAEELDFDDDDSM